ncbi:hypothetical protein [Clostridium beijerinckii]|uniref:hypothetical protein n=1 Tax=Clostridium beijerinckii TaxID=1520 RepID=UPI0003D2DC1F|nr:hypothetical protein [Clostridium beijerinckii]AYK27006.1 hypothetical protein X276_27555 [Clostridium beijerinckii NRRL B-598]
MSFKDKIRLAVIGISILVVAIFMYKADINKNKVAMTKENAKTIAVENIYSPTQEEKNVLKKSYEDIVEGKDYTIYSDLDKKYDSMSETKRQNIKNDIERLRNEKNAYDEECKKQSAQNEQIYSKLINEIQNDYPNMRVTDILGKDDKKSLLIDMNLLNNISETEEKACTLAVMKETRMKEVGISSISIALKDGNGKAQGILAFKLNNGQYKPYANIIN